jgi:hypothetical protein
MLSLQQPMPKNGMVGGDQKILDTMVDAMPASFPEVRSSIILLGTYIWLLWFFLKKMRYPGRRRRRYSIYLLLMIIVFSAMGYWHFTVPTSRHNFSYNSFCQLEGYGQDKVSTGKYIIGLYSLQKLNYRLTFGAVPQPVRAIVSKHSSRKIPHPHAVEENYSGQRISGFLDTWSHIFYMIDSRFDSPIRGHALQDRQHLRLSIKNKLPRKITHCLVYFKKRFLFIDDIPADTKQTITLKLADLKKTEIFNDQEIDRIIEGLGRIPSSSYLKNTRNQLIKNLLIDVDAQYRSKPDSMVLIGWVQTGLIQPVFERSSPLGENLTLVNWELPVGIHS